MSVTIQYVAGSRPWSLFVLVVVASTAAVAARLPPDVTLYGASWCGPCRTTMKFLRDIGVPFRFRDIDEDANRRAYQELSHSERGIPLTTIGSEHIRGANLTRLRLILERVGYRLRSSMLPSATAEIYGGFPTSWWEMQFRDLRRRVASQRKKVEELDRVAVDHHERGVVLQRMREDLTILEDALDQLELDASRVALPRRYRAY